MQTSRPVAVRQRGARATICGDLAFPSQATSDLPQRAASLSRQRVHEILESTTLQNDGAIEHKTVAVHAWEVSAAWRDTHHLPGSISRLRVVNWVGKTAPTWPPTIAQTAIGIARSPPIAQPTVPPTATPAS